MNGGLLQDLRFAFHSLNRDRRFTLLAVLALALGIGSVTVIFSAVYGVLIDTSPYGHYDRMVSFSFDEPGQQVGREDTTMPELLDFREQNHVFQDMNAGTSIDVHYIHGNQTTQWSVTRETANGYVFLGVKPLVGTVLGLFLSWAATRLIQNQLWNVKATDPWTMAAITAILLLVGLLACASPAREASKVDPMVALRYE